MGSRIFVTNELPANFLRLSIEDLAALWPEPTLVTLPGRKSSAVFVAILLHGNEHTGFRVVKQLLEKYDAKKQLLPRRLILYFGNLKAAQKNLRMLSDQPDYNRIWRGDQFPECQFAKEILSYLKNEDLFAAIDIHNNTGRNPHYGCISRLDAEFLQLAHLFGPTGVHFTRPKETLANALSDFVPAITIECGQSLEEAGIKHAVEFVDACLHLDHFPNQRPAASDLSIFETVARIKIPKDASFAFEGEGDSDKVDFLFRKDLDLLNFKELPISSMLGRRRQSSGKRLIVEDDSGIHRENWLLHYFDDKILTSEVVFPSMLTLDRSAILNDCLGYLMKVKSPEE